MVNRIALAWGLAIGCAVVTACPRYCAALAGDTSSTHAGVEFAGQVVDLETKKPVRGAPLTVERSLPGIDPHAWPGWAGKTTHVTDADGRFRVSFPAEQVSEERLAVAVAVSHPDYVGRKTITAVPLVSLMIAKKAGDTTLFDKIQLQRGEDYAGEVVSPAGDPVAGAAVELSRWGDETNPSPYFTDLTTATTGPDGRFRLRCLKAQQLAVFVTTPHFAHYQHYWGADDPSQTPEDSVPLEFGRITLSSGVRLHGRLVDLKGRPIAGEEVTAHALGLRGERTTKTDARGEFAFAPLRPGNHVIHGAGQRPQEGVDPSEPPVTRLGAVFKPVKVYLRDGVVPAPVTLREVPTVVVETQFVDSKDRPTGGYCVALSGALPLEAGQQAAEAEVFEGNGLAAVINGAQREDKSPQVQWAEQLVPDAQGRVVFRVPKGVNNAQLQTQIPDETKAIRIRPGPNKPLEWGWGATLGELTSDLRGVKFVVYKSPRLLVRVQSVDGTRPFSGSWISAFFTSEGGEVGANFLEQADERHRSQNLLPDQEYVLAGGSAGFVANRVERVKMGEGTSAEITLVVRPQPKPPQVGDLAPPFFVKTRDGQAISLDDLRGKFVLFHFWHPQNDECAPEAANLKAVKTRFGSSERLVMLGFCPVFDSKPALEFIKDKGLTWPQVFCRDGGFDATIQEYELNIPAAVLIGPDGRVIARDLQGKKIEEAVAKALRDDKSK
jgi:peroxiredoxin